MSQNGHKKIYWVKTSDGWKIALHRRQGKKFRLPVVLVHGLASNFTNMDFPLPGLSLAQYLFELGFDCWIIDLRGSGLSKRRTLRPLKWYFDDFVFKDLPAALRKIRQVTRAKKVHWIGHSLGGLLAFPICQTFNGGNPIHSLITVATPLTTRAKPGYFKYLYHLDGLLRWVPGLPYKPLSKLVAWFPEQVLKMEDHILFSRNNMTVEIIQTILRHSVESVPSSLILQIHDWFRHNYFSNRDGTVNFLDGLEGISLPILMMVGSIDSFTPSADIRLAFKKIPNADKTLMAFGKKYGHENEYGHIDLILGKNAPREVFPHIAKWLTKHDQKI
jgi:pimeloyl-ACP methyl ester carboxylesterase